VGAPTTAKELGVEPEDVIEALVKAKKIRPERFTILDKKKLNEKSAKALAKKTGVI
jgi:glycerol-1-phosphate dehydrogenase [NAD(P)+]